jgi:hypothetical protein
MSDFPDWAPPPVVEAARTFLAGTGHKALIWRLVADPRMRGVWRELDRRNSAGRYLHPWPRWLPREWEPLREEFQSRALAQLFLTAARRYFWSPTVARAKLDERCRRYLEPAARLREAGIEDLAVECERRAQLLAEGLIVVDRATGNLRLRGYLANLAGDTKKLFGATLYRSVATIASVVFEQRVTVKMVREAVGTTNTLCR